MDDLEKCYTKWTLSPSGQRVKRYRAIDPAELAIVCTCGREGCYRAKLLPFREHIVEIYRAIILINDEELAVWEPSRWESVLYALQMAASIEDIEADTGYVEDPMTFALCETSIDYEDAQSEIASKYVAAVTIFNFLWQAYEAIISITALDQFPRLIKEKRHGERGRRILEKKVEIKMPGISDLVKLALLQCRRGGLMDERCDNVVNKFGNNNLVAAAELSREFRNFVFHGGDKAPVHEDWGDVIVSRCRIYRFYSVSRLILYLMQAMCWIIHEDITRQIKYGSKNKKFTPSKIFEFLQFKEIVV